MKASPSNPVFSSAGSEPVPTGASKGTVAAARVAPALNNLNVPALFDNNRDGRCCRRVAARDGVEKPDARKLSSVAEPGGVEQMRRRDYAVAAPQKVSRIQ